MAIRKKENFTEEYIKSLTFYAKSYEVVDTKIRNFFCRISPKGVKTYLVIKNVKQKPVYITIGKAEEINLKDARIKAVEIIDELNKDKNRNTEKSRRRIFLLSQSSLKRSIFRNTLKNTPNRKLWQKTSVSFKGG